MRKTPERHPKKRVAAVGVCLLLAGGVAGCASYAAHRQSPVATATPEARATTPSPEQCLAKLPAKFLAGQVLLVGVSGGELSSAGATFQKYDIGGAVIMTAPDNPNDGSLLKFKKEAGSRGVPVLLATDEEGGRVQRFSTLGVLAPPQEVAGSMSPSEARQMIAAHGRLLKTIGIDMVLGPLADVAPPDEPSPLGDRVFSSDTTVVSNYAKAYVHGWQDAGLIPTLKHFPGMGSATANTDYQPAAAPPFDQLKQRDFVPYQGAMAATGTAVMIGNQNVPGWFEGPASLSPTVNRYLRTTLGYHNNFIVTDSLSVPGVTASMPEAKAAIAAVEAGNDMALLSEPEGPVTPSDAVLQQAETGIEEAIKSGKLSEQQLVNSVMRKLSAQHIDPCSIK